MTAQDVIEIRTKTEVDEDEVDQVEPLHGLFNERVLFGLAISHFFALTTQDFGAMSRKSKWMRDGEGGR